MPTASSLREPNRPAVRLLFAGFVGAALLLTAFREVFDEPYPAPFMPAFKGNALEMISPTEAAIYLPTITVRFDDGSTSALTLHRLFADGPASAVRVMLYLVVPDPAQVKAGSRGRVHQWLERFLPSRFKSGPAASTALPADVRAYLQHRVEKLFPDRKPVSLSIAIDRGVFPLSDYHRMTTTVANETTIPFR